MKLTSGAIGVFGSSISHVKLVSASELLYAIFIKDSLYLKCVYDVWTKVLGHILCARFL